MSESRHPQVGQLYHVPEETKFSHQGAAILIERVEPSYLDWNDKRGVATYVNVFLLWDPDFEEHGSTCDVWEPRESEEDNRVFE